jgi:hypothetical protein
VTIKDLLGDLAAIDTGYLSFDVPQNRVLALYGIDPATLQCWTADGLRAQCRPDGTWHYASTELHYLALRAGRGGVYRRTIQAWADAARASRTPGGRTRINYYAQPVPGLPTGAEMTVLTPAGRQTVEYRPSAVVASYPVPDAVGVAEPDGALRDVLSEIAGLQLVFVPDELRGSADFLRRTGFVDCEDAGTELLRRCGQRGIEARAVFGLVASQPLATPHACVEVRIGTRWHAVSPLLVGTMHRFGGLDREQFPAWSALGSAYVPLAEKPTVLATCGDVEMTIIAQVAASPPVIGAAS